VSVPLPWERLLWSGRSRWFGARYILTDFRIVKIAGARTNELVLRDVGDVHRVESTFDRLLGTSTLVVDARSPRVPSLVLGGVSRGAEVAALIELLAGDPRAAADPDAIRAALAGEPRSPFRAGSGLRETVVGIALVAIAVFGVAIGLQGRARPIAYAPDDPIAPGGEKRPTGEIARFMESDVMPWARTALAPIAGGSDRVRCETCHGRDGQSRGWQMPAVAALPAPDLRDLGWERYNSAMDAQMRNAIYGYLAEPEKQTKATYMREVVMPGMARILKRPPYDFTRPYAENRARNAIGCYHCHRVK
jgi:cytochrome c553